MKSVVAVIVNKNLVEDSNKHAYKNFLIEDQEYIGKEISSTKTFASINFYEIDIVKKNIINELQIDEDDVIVCHMEQ